MENQDDIVFEITSVEDIENAVKTINEKGIKNVTIMPVVFCEKYFHDKIDLLKQLESSEVSVHINYSDSNEKIPLEEIIKDEEFLDSAVEDILKQNFSQLEKLAAAYDIVKTFKPYNLGVDENGQEKYASSRGIYEILRNKDIVCVGYTNVLENLCHRLDINVIHYPIIGTKGNGMPFGHEECYVYLKDSKYGIDGYYIMDPTLEQGGKIEESIEFPYEVARSSYEKFLMTTKENIQQLKGQGIDIFSFDTVLNSENQAEIMENIENVFLGTTFREDEIRSEQINSLGEMDPELKEILKEFENPFYFFYPRKDYIELMQPISKKSNKPIDKSKLLEAVINVKKSSYKNFSEQDFEDMKMMYSLNLPFARKDEKGNIVGSLYGEDYFKYAGKRYLQLRDTNEQVIEEKNPCLDWKMIEQHGKMALDYKIFTEEEFEKKIQTRKEEKDEISVKKLGEQTLEEQKDTKAKMDMKEKIELQVKGYTKEDKKELNK